MEQQTKGRAVNTLPSLEFDNGAVVRIRKVGLMSQQEIARALKKEWEATGKGEPRPPVVQTDLGPEINHADPDYEAAKEQWTNEFNAEYNQRVIKVAALEAEFDVDLDALARRKRSLSMVGVTIEDDSRLTQEENDRVNYFYHIIAATQGDIQMFYNALMHASIPTREAVQERIDSFPDNVPGPGHHETSEQDTEVGTPVL